MNFKDRIKIRNKEAMNKNNVSKEKSMQKNNLEIIM